MQKSMCTGSTKKSRTRGNGEGSVFRRGDKWAACVTIYDNRVRRTKTKYGLLTKRAANEALADLKAALSGKVHAVERTTFAQLYDRWEPYYEPRVGKTTMDGYHAAYLWFATIHSKMFTAITTQDLQDCVDACKCGRRTKENMKCLAMQLYKYAGATQLCERNYAQYIYCGNEPKGTREAFTLDEVEKIRTAASQGVPYAEHVLAMIYTGFRPGELLGLVRDQYDAATGCLVGGGKTAAGTNRNVTISPKIQPIVERRAAAYSPYIFGDESGKRINDERFRKYCFAPLMEILGITGKVPYSCRHTFANLLKNVAGSNTDKAALMGHTDIAMTEYYQSADLQSLRSITDAI